MKIFEIIDCVCARIISVAEKINKRKEFLLRHGILLFVNGKCQTFGVENMMPGIPHLRCVKKGHIGENKKRKNVGT
jgi:hypothetical protein